MSAEKRNLSVVVSAGGTGGHLFPAQALTQELHRRHWRTALITDRRGLKWRAHFPHTPLYATLSGTTEQPGWLNRITAVVKLALGTLQAWAVLRRQRPGVVIGFGGYPMLPAMFAAVATRRVTCIHEANGVMGRANRLMAPRVTGIALTFPDPKGLRDKDKHKARVTGNPVRDAVIEAGRTPYPPLADGAGVRLLVFGGSQGARIFSTVVPQAIGLLPDDLRARLHLVQQCREEDLPEVRQAYEALGVDADLAAFFDDMPARMARAHLVICRSGASTICELSAIGRPALMVPLPGALDGDQTANAAVLADAGGGWLVPEAQFTPETLAARLTVLLGAPQSLARAAAAARALGRPEAVQALADMVEQLALGNQAMMLTEAA